MASQHILAGFIRTQIHNHAVAEDIVQEVARDATANFHRYDTSRPFVAWLIGIARQRMAEYFRKQSRQSVTFSTDIIDSVAEAYCKLQPEVDERIEALRLCIDQLSDRHRQVIRLRYDQQYTPEEVATRVGAHRNAVNVMLHRIRIALAECVRRQMEVSR